LRDIKVEIFNAEWFKDILSKVRLQSLVCNAFNENTGNVETDLEFDEYFGHILGLLELQERKIDDLHCTPSLYQAQRESEHSKALREF
jgi:hypothetical protein